MSHSKTITTRRKKALALKKLRRTQKRTRRETIADKAAARAS